MLTLSMKISVHTNHEFILYFVEIILHRNTSMTSDRVASLNYNDNNNQLGGLTQSACNALILPPSPITLFVKLFEYEGEFFPLFSQ